VEISIPSAGISLFGIVEIKVRNLVSFPTNEVAQAWNCHVGCQGLLKTPVLQDARAVWKDLNTGAYLLYLSSRFKDADFMAGKSTADCASETSKTRANYQYI
jgi:hypothetical protein